MASESNLRYMYPFFKLKQLLLLWGFSCLAAGAQPILKPDATALVYPDKEWEMADPATQQWQVNHLNS